MEDKRMESKLLAKEMPVKRLRVRVPCLPLRVLSSFGRASHWLCEGGRVQIPQDPRRCEAAVWRRFTSHLYSLIFR